MRDVDWNELVAALPEDEQEIFERLLRRSLKRRLKLIEKLDTSVAPDHVRSQAVSTWRKRYMTGATKAEKKRMNYVRLRSEPTYLSIERNLSERYWKSLPAKTLPKSWLVDDVPLDVACRAYAATRPRWGSTPLDAFIRQTLEREYAESGGRQAAQERMAERVLGALRTKNVSDYLRVGSSAREFNLRGTTDELEVMERMRSAHVIEAVVRATCKERSVYLSARGIVVALVMQRSVSMALQRLAVAMLGAHDPVQTVVERIAKTDARRIEQYVLGDEFAVRAAKALLQNPRYGAQYWQAVELRLRVRENVPQTPMEAYPSARSMERRFVLHVGPTNSGKTHDALQALAAAPSGAYLGPLRLLAYEKFEELNRMGCVCSLLTGEESTELPGARHVSSTVEMANYYDPIDVAVIDEAQMIADDSRGHHWTAAILGIPAREVHVCCAPHAERVVRDLVGLCEDELVVVRHERLVPLLPDKGGFSVPTGVEAGDALVVFSRRSVHALAAQVAAAGFRPSVIYGALPHDVRHEEARRFDAGETDVVVATDAIGMGMNLPIRRVVFVEQEKFDGHSTRMLRPEEIQQIAGRAGRFGRYDVGYYQSTRLRRDIVRRYEAWVPPISSIPVGIPEDISLVRDATLTDCILQWMAIEQPQPFRRIDVSRDLKLIGVVEGRLAEERRTAIDDKLKVLSLATMAFDERERDLYRMWLDMVDAELAGRELEFAMPDAPAPGTALAELERQYRVCDLLYTYARTFGHTRRYALLDQRRNEISHAIMALLAGS